MELSRLSGIEPRTIRSYIYQGLLRGPETVGRNARYSRHHLDRLRAIRALREGERLSLNEIRQHFLALSDEEIAAIGDRLADAVPERELQVAESALDYIRALRERLRAEGREAVAPQRAAERPFHGIRDDSTPLYAVATAPTAIPPNEYSTEPLDKSSSVQERRMSMPSFEARHADQRTERMLARMEELAESVGALAARLGRYEHQAQDLHELGFAVRELRRRHGELLQRVAALQSDVEALRRGLGPSAQQRADEVPAERDEPSAGEQAKEKDR